MRIHSRSIKFSGKLENCVETPTWSVEYGKNSYVFDAGTGKKCVIEGDIYYYVDKKFKPTRIKPSKTTPKLLSGLYAKAKGNLPDILEGMYTMVVVDQNNDTITVSGDAYSRVNLFYTGRCKIVSTEIDDILPHFGPIEYDQAAMACIMLLGYPPLKHTPYSGLHRLAVGEKLVLKDGHIAHVPAAQNPIKIAPMGDGQLLEYERILENSILSRASGSENWAEISGGWDSTIILGVLRKYFKKNVRASVLTFKLKGGRRYNPYEVDKSIEIAKHYKVPLSVTTVDFGGADLPKITKEAERLQRPDMMFTWLPTYHIIAEPVRNKGKKGAAAFVGSFSDAIHNFGFSQFASLPYLSYDFREYSDKVRSYLYSPAFLKKVKDNTFEGDFAYKLFRWHCQGAKFVDTSKMTEKERVFEYLLSFVLSGPRVPFAEPFADPIFTDAAKERARKWLYDNYFAPAVENITDETMYFWLIWLYQHFHMQGFEKGAVRASLSGTDKRPCWPFYDMLIIRFLSMMPQDWGRGLEWRHIKYPLKHYAKERLKIPYKIVESTFHSYIDETEQDRTVDWRAELMHNSTLTETVWKDSRDADVSRFFDAAWFDRALVEQALKTGMSKTGTALPFNLLSMMSAMGSEKPASG